MAASLSLPFEPDFTVDVCGVGGLVEDVPGYYIDYVRINALGGAMEFNRAPFVVVDLPSPEGGTLDGILGMNFFWNRNVSLEPFWDATGLASAFAHVSAPIPVAYADNDVDFDVDREDAATWIACITGPGPAAVSPECDHFDRQADFDVDLEDWQTFQHCFSGNNPADPTCAP